MGVVAGVLDLWKQELCTNGFPKIGLGKEVNNFNLELQGIEA